MAKRRGGGGGGGGGAPEWLVTFADLMSLLCCFFVLIISFSTPDDVKVQTVAGSMRDAFGFQPEQRRAAVVEVDGVPVRRYLKEKAPIESPADANQNTERNDSRAKQGPEANTHDIEKSEEERPRQFVTAAASIRQAWQDMPEITELSKNILLEETEEGLNIQIMDQDGRSMFPEGAKNPYDTTRRLLAKLAPVLAKMPHKIRVTGHTSSGAPQRNPAYSSWDLSTDRALVTHRILTENGISKSRFDSIVGRADTDPLFPNDPFLASNRRISILLIAEKPPLPPNHRL